MRSPTGDILVDGGVMNNLPVDVMREMCGAGRVLAVDLRSEVHMPAGDLPETGVLCGWWLLARRLNPLGAKPAIPSIADLIMRSAESGSIVSRQALEEKMTDLIFRPPVGGFALMEFEASAQLIETGYRHASQQLRIAWRAG
jgi:predicted acylesterase/phospholipase RssA